MITDKFAKFWEKMLYWKATFNRLNFFKDRDANRPKSLVLFYIPFDTFVCFDRITLFKNRELSVCQDFVAEKQNSTFKISQVLIRIICILEY